MSSWLMAGYLEIDTMQATRISISIIDLVSFKYWLTEVGSLVAYWFLMPLNFGCHGHLAISIFSNIYCGHFPMVSLEVG
jgi:hypothetical protein